MGDQVGLLYYVAEQYVAIPNTTEGLRLFRRLSDGKYYVKHSDDTIELFSSGTGSSTTLFEQILDVGNVAALENDLYVDQILANTLLLDGDAVSVNYAVRLANTLNAKTVRLYFAGQKIFESIIDYSTGQQFDLNFDVFLIRLDSDTLKTIVSYVGTGVQESQINEINGLNFTNINPLTISGQGVNNDDIVAKFDKGVFVPKS